jgi:hypothetical protein
VILPMSGVVIRPDQAFLSTLSVSLWIKSKGAIILTRCYLVTLDAMKYTQTTLDKIERVLEEAEYIVRYERGTFQSGYCILEERKVVVLNKFLQMEGRINTLIDIIPQLKMHPEMLTPEARKVYDDVLSAHHVNEG